ncbi:hypothetical protein I3843_04G048300 [Carya illinoinensis]|nr:hypothetical protein I3760_04G052300 [Carya illinoinensis]KAG2710924.1 hypothetical protein I3760_04G052300 [Carya illinoinensis]KAG2710925.1 hypothetical protein I3760_04G052300 [Carya illinoinensis]KAG7982357.1 hypothetical protein I3843_04G048300 [Carya illinoinensis]KAG7982359.1 hypothetical protein I3843_04G048300 [Carya illinoinensis]
MSSTFLPRFTPLYVVFFLSHLSSTVDSGSPSPYNYPPTDYILLNCGFTANSTADGRTWTGEMSSDSLLIEQSPNQSSVAINTSEIGKVPFTTARVSLSPFTYVFPVTAGQKFIRLYFYPASHSGFDRSKAFFSVKAGPFTLLSNFNASLTAAADEDPAETIFREYCVNIEEHQRFNIIFTPSPNVPNSYAFINGIEIWPMPSNLYYSPAEDQGFSLIGENNQYSIKKSTALETVYRLNVGGRSISPSEDTGMFRSWIQDDKYLKEHEEILFLPVNYTINLNFTQVREYTAPAEVYRTARTMGTDSAINLSYNLTWEFSVDSGFYYFIRLHFCEFQPEINKAQDRRFRIFIANYTAEKRAADVIQWGGGEKGVPVYRDYAVFMVDKLGSHRKVNLYIAIGAEPQWTTYHDAILNGAEIFKVSDIDSNNLAGPNPDPLPLPPQIAPPRPSSKLKNNETKIIVVATGGVAGFVIASFVALLIFWRRKRVKDSNSTSGTTWWAPFSCSTTKSTKAYGSSLPTSLSRYFSLAEIRAATHNFDDAFIIGVGGFGKVYKGYIDGGTHQVAIKRLAPGSQQGAHEFETEIEMLSQLRHLHLVSLIGYCNDGNEMILVYDYMARGTLRDHLYNTNNPPLSWKQRLRICIGAAQGLNYLHTGAKHMIIHRDVKTTNILLDDDWVAKVSDFGLSKMGPTSVSKAHVSTVVKGSFGYLDPEYFRRQQLTEKSDVYSFGVVLCEVLSARPPISRTAKMKQAVGLAEWARQSYKNGKLDQIVDPALESQVAPDCLKKFGEIAANCLLDNGVERPSMNDVVWSLEFALQLQESIDKDGERGVAETEMVDAGKALCLPQSKGDYSDNLFSSCGRHASSSSSRVTITSSEEPSNL